MNYLLDFIWGTLKGRTIYRHLFNLQVRAHCRHLSGLVVDFAGGGDVSYYRYLQTTNPIVRTNRQLGPGVDQIVDLTERFPFAEGVIDYALFFNASYIINNHEHLWSEFHRVLRPGGVLYLAAPFVANEMPDPHDFGRLTKEGFETELRAAGFTDFSLYRFGGRATVATYALHPFLLHGIIRLPVYALALAVDWVAAHVASQRYPLPLGYFGVIRK